MIGIHKINDSETISDIVSEYNLKYDKKDLFLGVYSGSQIKEFTQYFITGNILTIKYLSDNTGDFSLIDGLMKTLLFLCDTVNTKKIIMPVSYDRAAKAIGFKLIGQRYELELDNYSNKCEGDGKE